MNIGEAIEANMESAKGKANSPGWRLLLLGVVAGLFIGLGAVVSSMAAHGLPTAGLTRLLTGLIFPVGLCLVILLGAELFTGNILMINALFSRKIGWRGLLKNWSLVYLGNFIGAIVLAALMVNFGQIGVGGEALAIHTAKIAAVKNSLPWVNAFVLAIFCNLLVCAAVYMALMAKSIGAKIIAIWVPIAAFVIAGFEHSVANMYYIPAGIFTWLNPTFTQVVADAGVNTASLNFEAFFLNNLIPVTLGNIVGGMLIGITLYAYHYRYSILAKMKPRRRKRHSWGVALVLMRDPGKSAIISIGDSKQIDIGLKTPAPSNKVYRV